MKQPTNKELLAMISELQADARRADKIWDRVRDVERTADFRIDRLERRIRVPIIVSGIVEVIFVSALAAAVFGIFGVGIASFSSDCADASKVFVQAAGIGGAVCFVSYPFARFL